MPSTSADCEANVPSTARGTCILVLQRILRFWLCSYEIKAGSFLSQFNPLKTKRRPFYLKTHSVPRCKHFSPRYKNQSVYAVSGTSRCLFSDKYKTHKYSEGRAYSC